LPGRAAETTMRGPFNEFDSAAAVEVGVSAIKTC